MKKSLEEHHACESLVVDHTAPESDDAARVVGREISEGMLEQARQKAGEAMADE